MNFNVAFSLKLIAKKVKSTFCNNLYSYRATHWMLMQLVDWHHSQLFSVLGIRKKKMFEQISLRYLNPTNRFHVASSYDIYSLSTTNVSRALPIRWHLHVIHYKSVSSVANLSAKERNPVVKQICMRLVDMLDVSNYHKFSKLCYLNPTIPNGPF